MSVGEGDAGPPSPIAEWLDAWRTSDAVAFESTATQITYREFASRIAATSAALVALGVAPGDRVAYCGLNRVEIFDLLFACARQGAILFPVNNRLTVSEMAAQFADSDPALLVASDGFASMLSGAAPGRRVLDLDAEPLVAMVAEPATSELDAEWPTADQDLLIVYTSGTTGSPKGAMLSHRALDATVTNGLEAQRITSSSRVLAPLPTFHVGGLNIQTVPALAVGAQVSLVERFSPDEVLASVERVRPTHALLVPAMLDAVANHPRFGDADLTSLVGISTGSSVVPMASMQPYVDRGVPVAQIYGATETGPTAIVMAYDEVEGRATSCGRRAELTDFRIVDPATGQDQPVDVDGEILLRGPNLFSRYWRNDAATAAAFVGDWYRTGDVGRVDTDGYVWISDRLTDMLISGGENIYPAEVEAVLSEHPGLAEVTVVGRPDPQWGERCVAVAIAADSPCSLEELRAWAGERLARYKLPRELVWVEELPRTALGKVQKHEVRASLSA